MSNPMHDLDARIQFMRENMANMMKVTPVTGFDDTSYQVGPITNRVREMYWDWAASSFAD